MPSDYLLFIDGLDPELYTPQPKKSNSKPLANAHRLALGLMLLPGFNLIEEGRGKNKKRSKRILPPQQSATASYPFLGAHGQIVASTLQARSIRLAALLRTELVFVESSPSQMEPRNDAFLVRRGRS